MLTVYTFLFEGGMSHLPLLDPSMRAIPLSPPEWKERLEAINKTDLRAKDYHDRDFILLDVRNASLTATGGAGGTLAHGSRRPASLKRQLMEERESSSLMREEKKEMGGPDTMPAMPLTVNSGARDALDCDATTFGC
ncbi:hypothetical protein VIGAN_04159300 [Vigna angularis var. angularis]|uniref:Uncharacterized protein n=1 Tax=Vigna angularis var. angularis TaxID=157739 RepID=A0A0S3RV14_PHAAN|nr:hypothetical protein VIGAN_04159300 [Vigna angularis var. angularis]